MARPQSQARMGYFPVSPQLLDLLLPRLKVDGPTAILDPCCGEGAAVSQIAKVLPCAAVRAIELDESRHAASTETIGGWAHDGLLPDDWGTLNADFLGTEISKASFGFCWLNPPYDDEPGGGRRMEYSFLVRATPLLVTGGIMAMLLPETATRDVERYFAQWYDDATWFEPPTELRPYNEVLLVGKKRSRATECERLPHIANLHLCNWTIPPAPGPKIFRKTRMTPAERERALDASPLNRHLAPAPEGEAKSSVPLPLSKGHLALLLASGRLDGVVQADGEPPHVIRGTARKEKYLKSCTEEETETGIKTTKVISEKIILSVRRLDSDGQIQTLE